jgi:two-component system, response regulator, stage 0 sporulation protein F
MQKILLVEDDKRLQTLIRDELEEESYEIILASDGKQAISFLKEGSISVDLIIMDLRMPNMDGLDAIGHLLKARLNIPIIIHTAYSSYKNDPLAMAADAYVVKSHDLTELKAKIKDLIGDKA